MLEDAQPFSAISARATLRASDFCCAVPVTSLNQDRVRLFEETGVAVGFGAGVAVRTEVDTEVDNAVRTGDGVVVCIGAVVFFAVVCAVGEGDAMATVDCVDIGGEVAAGVSLSVAFGSMDGVAVAFGSGLSLGTDVKMAAVGDAVNPLPVGVALDPHALINRIKIVTMAVKLKNRFMFVPPFKGVTPLLYTLRYHR